ncbi:MAG: polysaccharide lyase 6 family protein [Tenuifilaceae bacterium]
MVNSNVRFSCYFFTISLLLLFTGCGKNTIQSLDSSSDINKVLQKTQPGDTIFLKDGYYKDVQIVFKSKGTKEKPIVLCAKNEGKVTFQGNSSIRISGEFLVIKGIIFQDGFCLGNPVIEFRTDSKNLAKNCRVTECVIDGYNQPDRSKSDIWVALFGKNNRFDHNILQNKLSAGVTLAVLRDDSVSINNHHQIDHNYFGKRIRLGSNGGETMRIGTSKNSLLPSNTVIEDNYFYQCDGEVEIISIKSCNNTIRRNTFVECEGSLVLRHGNNNVVESNIFLGNNKHFTGGVRVINSGHKIYNNFFYRLKGDRFRSAFTVMNGVPNSLINRYHQVNGALIGFNTFIDCSNIGFCVGMDNERTAIPVSSKFYANLIINQQENAKIEFFDDVKGISFSSNLILSKSNSSSIDGFSYFGSGIKLFNGILYSEKELSVVDANDFSFVINDITGNARGDKLTIGALQKDNQLVELTKTAENVTGINWYNTDNSQGKEKTTAKIHYIKNPSESLLETIDKISANDIIELTDTGTFILNTKIEISKPLTIRSSKKLDKNPVLKYSGKESGFAFFTIINGGSLILEGISIDGESFGENNPNFVVLAKAPMIEHYNISINNCEFSNFTESNFSVLKGEKNTFADTILVQNSIFREMSCDAISLASEKDDNGRYNTENLIIKNCVFHKIMGNAINLYRGGNDESTLGPFLVIDHCVFNEVNNREAGSVLRLIGVQNAIIKNSIFLESGKGGYIAKFDEMPWDNCKLEYCNIYNSGRIGSNNNRIAGKGILNINPQLNNTNQLDFFIAPNLLSTMQTNDGRTMGCIWLDNKLVSNF